MQNTLQTHEPPAGGVEQYEPPALTEIGDATDVIRGVPGVGLDGPHGYSDPDFEFLLDD